MLGQRLARAAGSARQRIVVVKVRIENHPMLLFGRQASRSIHARDYVDTRMAGLPSRAREDP
jgi:hypothetical protein